MAARAFPARPSRRSRMGTTQTSDQRCRGRVRIAKCPKNRHSVKWRQRRRYGMCKGRNSSLRSDPHTREVAGRVGRTTPATDHALLLLNDRRAGSCEHHGRRVQLDDHRCRRHQRRERRARASHRAQRRPGRVDRRGIERYERVDRQGIERYERVDRQGYERVERHERLERRMHAVVRRSRVRP
jgi:hypothetical protein